MSLFRHHAADPAEIRRLADDAAGKGTAFRVLSGSLAAASITVKGEIDGFIEPVHTVTAAPEASSDEMSKASLLAAGCMNKFATAVETYNSGIDRLNERYRAAKVASFGVVCDGDPGDRDSEIAAADGRLQATLRREQAKLLAALDAEAEAIATVLGNGPNEKSIVLLIAAGHLPPSAVEGVPWATANTLRTFIHEARKTWKTPGKIRKLIQVFRTAKDLEEVADELARLKAQWGPIIASIGRDLDRGKATWNPVRKFGHYLRAHRRIKRLPASELKRLRELKRIADTAGNARTSWINAARASGKVGGPLAVLSVASSTYSLYDLAVNGPRKGTTGLDTTLRVTGSVAGLVSSGGGLLALTPVLSLGPVGAGVLIGAGLVAGGIAVYQNWDVISAGVSSAWDASTEWVSDTWDDAGEKLDDAGEAIGDAWNAVTPW